MQKAADSSLLLLGGGVFSIYDFKRRRILSHNVANMNAYFKANTRLIDANNLLFYTPENGLRRVNISKIPEAINAKIALFELLYRGGLVYSEPSYVLQNLNRYQDFLYWVEIPRLDSNREIYFYYLLLNDLSKVRFVKLPAALSRTQEIFNNRINEILKQMLSDELRLKELSQKFPEIQQYMNDIGSKPEITFNLEQYFKTLVPELFPELKVFNKVAFNGETLAFVTEGK